MAEIKDTAEIVVNVLSEEVKRISRHKEEPYVTGTICQAPHFLRHGNEGAYTPKFVSIGPYHRGENALVEMEDTKLRYFLDFTRRSGGILHDYVSVVEKNADKVRVEYSAGGLGLTRTEFVKMMVVDCCFIIEFLVKWFVSDRKSQAKTLMTKLPMLRNDLLLVENQVPYFLLDLMFRNFNTKKITSNNSLRSVALAFFMGDKDDAQAWVKSCKQKDFDHLLHLYHTSLTQPYRPYFRWIKLCTPCFGLGRPIDDSHASSCFPAGSRALSWIVKLSTTTFLSIMKAVHATLRCILPCFGLIRPIDDSHESSCFPAGSRALSRIVKISSATFLWIMKPLHTTLRCIVICIWMVLCCPILLPSCCQVCVTGRVRVQIGRDPQPKIWLSGIPNACNLRDTGFSFQKKYAKEHDFIDISRGGNKIKIPVLCIRESTLVLFRNLVALEQCSNKYGNKFTAYSVFMDYLVDTREDVAMLKESGIIDNRLGDDQKVADFFNDLCKGIRLDDDEHYLSALFNHVTEYYTSSKYKVRLYRWRKRFIPDYFTNPWAIPSMIAALILLALAALQTFYAVYAYYRPPSPT